MRVALIESNLVYPKKVILYQIILWMFMKDYIQLQLQNKNNFWEL